MRMSLLPVGYVIPLDSNSLVQLISNDLQSVSHRPPDQWRFESEDEWGNPRKAAICATAQLLKASQHCLSAPSVLLHWLQQGLDPGWQVILYQTGHWSYSRDKEHFSICHNRISLRGSSLSKDAGRFSVSTFPNGFERLTLTCPMIFGQKINMHKFLFMQSTSSAFAINFISRGARVSYLGLWQSWELSTSLRSL